MSILRIQQDQNGEEIDDCGIGIKGTLKASITQLSQLSRSLKDFSLNSNLTISDPIYFDSTHDSRRAYAEALSLVQNRFWTTTYLSSGFWTKEDVDIIGANTNMLARLKHNKGSAKRLFLLKEPLQSAANLWRQDLIDLRNQNKEYEIQKRKGEFDSIKRNVYKMIQQGTEVKVAYQDPNQPLIPPFIARPIGFEYGDSEIAIYDTFSSPLAV